MPNRHVLSTPPAVTSVARIIHLGASLLLAFLAPAASAQIRPNPGGGGGPIGGGGGGGPIGGGGIIPPIIIGPGGGSGVVAPTAVINTPRGAVVGEIVSGTASITPPLTTTTPTNPARPVVTTYQWNINGGRIVGDTSGETIRFVADRIGTVTLGVTINSSSGSFNTTADVAIFPPDAAGVVTAASTVSTSTARVTASVPAARNGDRTFRWSVTGGATILSGQNSRNIALRPGAPGLKEITCNVTLQNLVTIPVRSYLVVTGTGEPTLLTVDQGTGGGTYPAGSRVDIFADPPPPGHVFERWSGDTAVFGAAPLAPYLPHTVVTLPATPVNLTAIYKTAPAWSATTVPNFNPQTRPAPNNQTVTVSSTLTYHVPGDASGLVFLLHDSGGSGAAWLTRPEQLRLARDLVASGYGIAILDSLDRTNGSWTAQPTLATNADALNHAAAHDYLVTEGALAATAPIFLLGHGTSANTALRYADLLATTQPPRPVKGAVLYHASGIDTLATTSRVPQFFALSAHDTALGAAGLAEARQHAQLLLGRGIATGTSTNGVSPVHPGRFRALALNSPNFTSADAEAVWTAVKDAGFLDENNYPKTVPTTAALTAALPAAHRARAADVAAQIAIAAATAEFYSDANPRVIAFLNQRVAGAPAPTPGRLVNLSTRSRIAHLGDAFTVGFTLSGTERATLLIRGIGPALTRFRVREPLVAPRLEILQGTRLIASNQGWDRGANSAQISAAASAVGAFALNADALDTAALLDLEPGSYTVTIRALGGTVGDAIAEIYDVSRNSTRLTNLSALSRITEEGALLIPGIAIAGSNPRTLVVRAVGPGLTDFGHHPDTVLGDPRISVLNGNQTIAANNNWAQADAAPLTAAFPAIGAFPLRVANDAALLNALPPGTYTLQAGAAPIPPADLDAPLAPVTALVPNSTGSVLVEIYEVP